MGSSDHSSIIEIIQTVPYTQTKYLSKYGVDGPIVAHDINSSFYHEMGQASSNTPKEFWSYIGKIKGEKNITGTSLKTFYVLSKNGLSYEWEVVSGGSNIYIYGSKFSSTVKLKPVRSGQATLRLKVQSSIHTVYQTIDLTISTGNCLEGSYANGTQNDIPLNTTNFVNAGSVDVSVNCSGANNYTWSKTSGSVLSFWPSGSSVYFIMPSCGSISFLVVAKNGSTVISSRNIAFYSLGSFQLYPNPNDNNELWIDLNQSLDFEVEIVSMEEHKKILFIENIVIKSRLIYDLSNLGITV